MGVALGVCFICGEDVGCVVLTSSLFLSFCRDNIKSVFLQGFVLGLAQSTIFFIYSIGYSFGAFLVVEERATFDQLFR